MNEFEVVDGSSYLNDWENLSRSSIYELINSIFVSAFKKEGNRNGAIRALSYMIKSIYTEKIYLNYCEDFILSSQSRGKLKIYDKKKEDDSTILADEEGIGKKLSEVNYPKFSLDDKQLHDIISPFEFSGERKWEFPFKSHIYDQNTETNIIYLDDVIIFTMILKNIGRRYGNLKPKLFMKLFNEKQEKIRIIHKIIKHVQPFPNFQVVY